MKSIKKIVLVALVTILSIGTASAGPRFGLKLGMNVNKIHFSNVEKNFNKDNGCGFTGGVMTEFTLPLIGLGVDASLMYTRMNGDMGLIGMDDNSNILEVQSSAAKNFFEIPVNLKYKLTLLGIEKIVKPYFFTGPSFAFKLGGKDDVFKTKTFQCAWNIGLGLELFNHVQVGASYGFGMNNVVDKISNLDVSNEIKAKNNYWTITAAYLF